MQDLQEEKLDPSLIEAEGTCGRPGCICALPLGERFVLWALRQWQCELHRWEHDQGQPVRDSLLRRGFQMAGLLEALPDFAMAMDVLLFGAVRTLHFHAPPCSTMSEDEKTVVALCALAQGDFDAALVASLDAMMVPGALSAVAAVRLKAFAHALAGAGVRVGLPKVGGPLN